MNPKQNFNFTLMPELCMQHNTVTWVGDISRLRPDAWNKIKKTIEDGCCNQDGKGIIITKVSSQSH